jgi:hypothetical protein
MVEEQRLHSRALPLRAAFNAAACHPEIKLLFDV